MSLAGTGSNRSTPTFTSQEELIRNSDSEDVPWVVQKYGGTSVGKSLDSICRIVESYIPNSKVALVCSARSSETKALGTTNLLLQASKEALSPPNRNTASGSATPYFPKRVGSGFFDSRDATSPPPNGSGSAVTTPSQRERDLSPAAREMGGSLMSSISSLRELDLRSGTGSGSSSPSPFQPSGRRSGSPTSPMLERQVAAAAAAGNNGGFHDTVDTIKKGHLEAARKVIREGPIRDELEDEIERDCETLRGFLHAAQVIDEISPRSQDSIIGAGEKLACKIVAASLRDKGIDSEFVNLDTIVDEMLNEPSIDNSLFSAGDQGAAQLGQDFYDRLAEVLGARIRDCGCRVPVITGYFGPVPGSLLAQIGRGYTDLCAALCAVGLQASELQVWKEVDGIFTADPRKVPTARLVPVITPDEAAELTYYGSEVIHPFTMEQVIRARIPIRIKNVENPKGDGTIIYPDDKFPRGATDGTGSTEVSYQVTNDEIQVETKVPTAVTIKDNIIVLNIHSNRKTISHGFLARIFGTLDRAGVVVDLISTSEVHVSMAMQDLSSKKRLDRLSKDLEKIGDITVSKDMAILSLVGKNMRHAVGCAGMMFTALAKAGINIEMISQGASEINISCVIENKDSSKALNVIHDSCLTIPTSPTQYTAMLQ